MRVDRDEIEARLESMRAARRPALDVLAPDPVPSVARVGLVPGSFDPMTIAHAALADALRDLGCDLVLLVGSARALPKEEHRGGAPSRPLLDPPARVESLLAYAAPRPWLGVATSSHGLIADQAEAATRGFPGADLVVAVGSDKLLQIFDPAWYTDRDRDLERLFAAASLAYVERADDADRVDRLLVSERRWGSAPARLDLPPDVATVASRSIREALRRGDEWRAWVPAEVAPHLPA